MGPSRNAVGGELFDEIHKTKKVSKSYKDVSATMMIAGLSSPVNTPVIGGHFCSEQKMLLT